MADPQAPWTSGSEILANPGNANLASGSGSGSMPITVDAKPIYSVLDRLGDEDVKMRFQKQAQDREDQAALSKTLAEIGGKGGSAFNMKGADGSNVSFSPLPDDQKVLQSKADELRQIILKNPDKYDYDPQFLRKKEEYNYLLQHAGKRSILHSQNRLGAQQATDPEDREGYLKSNQDEILGHSLTDFHEPNTYLQKQTTDLEAIQSQKERENKENKTTLGSEVKDGYQTDKFGLTNEVADVRSRMVPGTKAYVEGVKLSQSFIKNYAQHPAWVEDMNAKILENNAERGLKPGDAHYQPPVAIVKPDGTVGFLSTDPAQITGAIFFASHGGVSKDVKPSNIDEQRNKIKADEQREKEQTAIARQTLWEHIRHNKAEEAKGIKPTTEQLKQNNDEKAGVAAYHEVKKVYDPANYKEHIPATPENKLAIEKSGYNPKEYEFFKVPASVHADQYIGVEAGDNPVTTKVVEGGLTTTNVTKTAKGESVKPDATVFVVNKNTGKGEFVYVKGNDIVAKVSEREAIANKLKHQARYDDKVYTNQVTHGQYAYDQGAPTETKSEPTPTGVKKTIKGVTYEKYSDGQWY